ncbi:MAG: fatty acid desaturase [Leptospirales bacterium]
MKNATATSRLNSFEKDIKAMHRKLKDQGYLERPIGRVIFSWVYNLILSIVPAVLFFYTDNMWLKFVYMYLAGLGAVGVGTMAHNASHGYSFRSSFANRFMEILGFTFIMGVSARFWDTFHNIKHHHQTNIVGEDPDTSVMPWFAIHEKQIENASALAKMYYKIQWIFFPFFFGFYSVLLQSMGWLHLTKSFFNFSGVQKEERKYYIIDVLVTIVHYSFWIGLFSLYFPLVDVLILYAAKNFVTGAFCFFALAPTHYTRDALYFEREGLNLSYYARQFFSTVDYKVGFLGSFLVNGVEYHLEHHLFPQVSHVFLKPIAKEVQSICKKHDLPYQIKSWPGIILDSYRIIIKPKVVDNNLPEKKLAELA